MMDYRNKVRALVGADTALALLIILGLVFSPRSAASRSTRRDLLADAAAVSAIAIRGTDSVELSRRGDAWMVSSPDGALPADGVRVEAFLKAVDSVAAMEKVASDESSLAELGLGADRGSRVTLSDDKGGILCDFTLGDYAASPGVVYIAPRGGTAAYSVQAGMASYVLGKRASWLDLRAWTAPPSVGDVQEIILRGRLSGDDGADRAFDYTATRKGDGWVAGGVELDAFKLEAMARALSALRGDDYAPASETAGATAVAVELRLGNGRSLRLVVEEKRADGRYAASSSQRDRRFYLPAWALDAALKTVEELQAH